MVMLNLDLDNSNIDKFKDFDGLISVHGPFFMAYSK